ncbi:glycosyltransferase family 9 protein [Klebsiella sp. BIGb0407]|uniref:glycosyltransferase family 9 protein n=1 Tax=Klebsiella sp. BIGb0407 TaxID=2940603 RepID=UPI002169F7E4|nr:glycosyltransferase family 9 protein [Klebsiella sp. BIGb0407]MCS3434144.1 ADP-heptose:LPS heptosyltransferase [Klebsiella sp. BIGb0407]
MIKRKVVSFFSDGLKKIRSLNRRRNYFIKDVKSFSRIFIAKTIWDLKEKNQPDEIAIKNILLLRNEGAIGDVIVDSALVKALHDGGYAVDFLLTKNNSKVMKYNPYIRNIYEADDVDSSYFNKKFNHNVPKEVIKKLAKNQYDLIIDPSLLGVPVHRMRLFNQINPRLVFGFNKWNKLNFYSKSFDFDCVNQHIVNSLVKLSEYLELPPGKVLPYDLHLPAGVFEDVKKFNETNGPNKKILINIFAGNNDRCISQKQLETIIHNLLAKHSDIHIVLLDHREEIKISLPEKVVINPFKTLYHVMALVHEADLIISPDTSIVHISAAWKKPLVAIYKNIISNNKLWSPGYNEACQIIIPSGKIHESNELPELIMKEIEQRKFLSHVEKVAE